ncbi:hypothetical protein [Burkholderia ubonensis]|uniref:hypothetical protein n=1 Tax=Burkholderia ubonensis TaxID=101571 RepID=UPI00075DA2CB|nr:hypothetical protein [Burkholderia ubonensis]
MATKRIRFVLDANYEQAQQFKFLRITLKRKYTPVGYEGPVLYSVHVKGYEFSGSFEDELPDGEYVVQAYLRHYPRGKGWGVSRTRSELMLGVRV